mmetsp:Transcript_7437/g.15410  ORF Transcript_7437/g.15410 Transcript_7437/m.15410 type:complete len:238 (-) Transcript_7437:203-916(-)
MHMRQGVQHLSDHVRRPPLVHRQGPLHQSPPRAQLHDEPQLPLHPKHLEQLDDVGMVQIAQDFDLVDELRDLRVGHAPGRHRFRGEAPVRRGRTAAGGAPPPRPVEGIHAPRARPPARPLRRAGRILQGAGEGVGILQALRRLLLDHGHLPEAARADDFEDAVFIVEVDSVAVPRHALSEHVDGFAECVAVDVVVLETFYGLTGTAIFFGLAGSHFVPFSRCFDFYYFCNVCILSMQ